MWRITLTFIFVILSHSVFAYDLYLVRHFEKQSESPDPGLTTQGNLRAQKLASFFASIELQRIYSTRYQRTELTAAPVAAIKSIPVNHYDPDRLSEFAEQLKQQASDSLIVGHSNTTVELLHLLGGQASPMSENDYGMLYILSFTKRGLEQRSINIAFE